MLKSIPVACALVALALLAPAAAEAATFTVNTTADTSVAGGCTTEPSCSLRDALSAAGASADPEDVVVLPAGDYAVENGQLDIGGTESVVLRGAGARSTTIDAHGTSRVFEALADKVTIEGVTITGGLASEALGPNLPGDGGGILAYEAEELILNRVAVSGNTAAKNGGGVSAPPEGASVTAVTIENSTIAGNHVTGGIVEGLGGGVYVLGDLTIVNSTIAGNSAESTAGMVQGGGVLAALEPAATEPSKVSILNATIAGNSVGTAGIGGGLAIYNPTPGVVTELSVKNTIVAGNTGPTGPSDCGTVAAIASDHNLSGDESCMFTDAGSKQNANPQLGPLQNNGGETDTMALATGSPAVDAGTNAGCPATDQRGTARPQGSACDIGAFELVPAPPSQGNPKPAPAKADLSLRIKAKPKKPHAGGKAAFLATVRNRGPAAAPGVVLKGTVPVRAVKATATGLGRRACKLAKPKRGKRRLTCRLGKLAAGKARKVRVTVRPVRPGKLAMRARVRSGLADPRLQDNRARTRVSVRT